MLRFCRIFAWIAVFQYAQSSALGNPHPDQNAVPKVSADFWKSKPKLFWNKKTNKSPQMTGKSVLRVRIDWDGSSYTFGGALKERSGTDSLERRSQAKDRLGSFRAEIYDTASGSFLATDSIGIGVSYRSLARALSFRFPMPKNRVLFRMIAEHARTGRMEKVLEEFIDPSKLVEAPKQQDIEVEFIKFASISPKLLLNIYAEGYRSGSMSRFIDDVDRAVSTLWRKKFPGFHRFEIRAVFAPSRKPLGGAANLGFPIPERDSFLSLYYPYWHRMDRWYRIVYPTREEKFRRSIAQVPYDYALVLVDSQSYWGVGNYRELTAIPARSTSFEYLLLHEMGHFFGLNEEYSGGGATELAFAPGIAEPWSQNITFQTSRSSLKWQNHVKASTPIPTQAWRWNGNGPYGAYAGGYGDTEPRGKSHKPGLSCVMDDGPNFCPICREAIENRVRFDLGITN